MSSSRKWLIAERFLFAFLTLLTLYPLLLPGYFVTLDGASHLYNSRIIFHLLGNDPGPTADFFRFNPENFTSYTGHLLLGLLNVFLPAWLAEKLLVAAMLIALPYAFRSLLKSLGSEQMILSCLIFPLSWSSLLFHGFYNFLIGLIFMLLAVKVWIKSEGKINTKLFLWLLLYLTLAAGSHVFAFLVAVGICIARSAWHWLFLKERVKLRDLALLLLSALPGFVILIRYLITNTGELFTHSSIGILESLKDIRDYKSAIGLSIAEEMFSAKWFYWTCLMVIVVFWMRVLHRRTAKAKTLNAILAAKRSLANDLLFALGILLISLFFFADRIIDRRLYVQDRLLYLGFMFITAWLAMQKFPRWFTGVSVALALIVCYGLTALRLPMMKKDGRFASEIAELSTKIEPGSVVLPVNFSNNWLHFHSSSYLGAEHDVIILDNYEASQAYFPIRWKPGKEKALRALQASMDSANYTPLLADTTIKYLVTLDEWDASEDLSYVKFRLMLNKYYKAVGSTKQGMSRLYRLSSSP